MISGSALLSLLVLLVVGGMVAWLFWWFIGYVGLPEPFNKVARVLVGLVVLIFLVNVLLEVAGHPLVKW